METGDEDSSETGSVTNEGKKLLVSMPTSSPDFRDKEESNVLQPHHDLGNNEHNFVCMHALMHV